MRITETLLFKTTAPFIKSMTKSQFAAELAKVKKVIPRHHFETSRHLREAFLWGDSPQGFDFWTNLFTESLDNGLNLYVNFSLRNKK